MASRILHLAAAEMIMRQLEINDKNRFRLGIILPDAYNMKGSKEDSHLKISVMGNSRKTYDLDKFRHIFREQMTEDELYMGYYLHLVQDLVFRRLLYGKYCFNPLIKGNVQRLYNDYLLINKYTIKKYEITNNVQMTDRLKEEKLSSFWQFEAKGFLEALKNDFNDKCEGEIFFFKESMADEFIHSAADICVKEIKAIENGENYIDSYEYAWESEKASLFTTTQNTRELGGYKTHSGKITKADSLIRSDVQNFPSQEDFEYLKKHNITTVIDMRKKQEVDRKPSGFVNKEGISYYNFQVEQGSSTPKTAEEVPKEYINIACAKGMTEVFRCISNAKEGVMFNCTAGKDRTGVVAAILLCHAGVSDKDIIENYVLTKEYGKERLELVHKNFPDADMNIITPNTKFMKQFLYLFREKFGDTKNYFREIGLSLEEINRITEKLI